MLKRINCSLKPMSLSEAEEGFYHWLELPQVLSRQTRACRDKHTFVATKLCLTRQKFCRDKYIFVATKNVFCRDNTFVATKMILVAPANDRIRLNFAPFQPVQLGPLQTTSASIRNVRAGGQKCKHFMDLRWGEIDSV